MDFEGQGSFDVSTNRRIDLSTAIEPRSAPPVGRSFTPEPDRFGATDCRGFEFTSAPPMRVRSGQRFTIAGRVTARDRADYEQALFRLLSSDADAQKTELAYTAVSHSGSFSVDVEVRAGREGQYSVEGFLFWQGAPPQSSRCRLSVLTVTP